MIGAMLTWAWWTSAIYGPQRRKHHITPAEYGRHVGRLVVSSLAQWYEANKDSPFVRSLNS